MFGNFARMRHICLKLPIPPYIICSNSKSYLTARYIIKKADAFASAFIFKSLIAFDVAYNIANSLDTFNRFVRNFNIKFFLD